MADITDFSGENISSLCGQYSNIENSLNSMDCSPESMNVPNFLDVSSDLENLYSLKKNIIDNANTIMTAVKNILIDGYYSYNDDDISINADMSFGEIQERLDYKYSDYLSFDEYQQLVDELLKLYSDKEQELAAKFNNDIKIQLAKLNYEIAPEIINSVIESVYLRQTQRKIDNMGDEIPPEMDDTVINGFIYGTEEYISGLMDFKSHITQHVLSNTNDFNLNEYYSNEQLEDKSDYEKSLLVLTNRVDSVSILDSAISEYESANFEKIDSCSDELKKVFENIETIRELFSAEYESAEDVETSFNNWSDNQEDNEIGYQYLNSFMNALLPPYYSFFENKNNLDVEKYDKLFDLSQRYNDITEEEIEKEKNKFKEYYEDSGSLDDEVYRMMVKLNKIEQYDLEYDCYFGNLCPQSNCVLPYAIINLEINGETSYVSMEDIAYMYENGDTNYSTNLIINMAENSNLPNKYLVDDAVILNISGISVQTYLSSIRRNVNNETGKFDYLRMFAIGSVKEEDKKRNIKINQNGIEFETNIQEIKDYYDYRVYGELYLIKHLYDNNRIADGNYNINIGGKQVNCSLKELSTYFDEDSRFDLNKFVSEFNLSESQYIYYYNHLLNNPINLDELNITASNKQAMEFFNRYGSVNQGGLIELIEIDKSEEEIKRLLDFCMKKYGLEEDDAYTIMRSLDSVGACSYANMCNIIYEMYDFDNEKFMHDFGYPMINEDGTLNGNQLLLDLYIYQNIGDKNNPDRLLIKDAEGSLHANENYLDEENMIMDVNNQEYMSGYGYFKLENLKSFLNNRNCSIKDYQNYQYEVVYFDNDDWIDKVRESFDSGSIVSLGFNDTSDYYSLGDECHYYHMSNSGHAVTGIGITEEGFIERTWGQGAWTPLDSINYGNAVVIYKKENDNKWKRNIEKFSSNIYLKY